MIGILIVIAICARAYFSPSHSRSIPGMLGTPLNEHNFDPPSFDELLHLALSAGQGDALAGIPMDEVVYDVPAFTSLAQARPWWSVWTSLDSIIHPPLYIQTLRLWRSALGESDIVAIAYSVLWSCVTLAFTYETARRVAGRTAGFWAALLTAIAPTQIYFGLEIRGYAMLTAWVAGLLYIVCRIQQDGATWKRAILLGGILLAILLTHYLAFTICLIAGVLALFYSRKGERKRIVAAGAAAAIVFAIIWLPFFLRQLSRTVDIENSYLDRFDRSLFGVIEIGMLLPLRMLREGWATGSFPTAIGLALLIGPLIVAWRYRALRPVAIIACLSPVVMLIQDASQHSQMIAFTRYCAPMSPAILVSMVAGIALACEKKAGWLIHVAGALGVVICLTYDPAHFPIRRDSPAMFPTAEVVGRVVKDDQSIVIHLDPQAGTAWWLLLELSHVPKLFPRDAIMLSRPMSPDQLSRFRTAEAWLVDIGPLRSPETWVPGAKSLEVIESASARVNGSGLRLYRLQLQTNEHKPNTPIN